MRTLWIIIVNFLKQTFNKKINYIFFFIVPVLSFAAIILLFGTPDNSKLNIGYRNLDSGSFGNGLISRLQKSTTINVSVVAEDQISGKIIDGSLAAALTIPENFSSQITDAGTPDIRLVSLQGATVTGFLQQTINQFINDAAQLRLSANGDEILFAKMYTEFLTNEYTMSRAAVSDNSIRKTAGSIGIGLFLFLMLIQAAGITNLMLKDKENRTFFRISIAPLREILYPLGNMLAAFFIMVIQIILTFGIVVLVFKIDFAIPLYKIIPLFVAFSLTAVCFGTMVTALARSTMQAALIANLIITPSCLLGGCFWPSSIMPAFIRRISAIFPQSWVMQAVEKMQNGASLLSISFTMLLLLAFGALFIAIYAYATRHYKNLSTFG